MTVDLVPEVPADWLVDVVNQYGAEPRDATGESRGPYPDSSRGRPPSIPQLSVRQLVRLADQVWPVFSAEPDERTAALNGLLATSRLTPSLDRQGRVLWWTSHHSPAKQVMAGAVVALLAVVQSSGWHRLGVCAGNDCADVHIDQRHRPRRYCSTTCLNRARVRAYRARQRQHVG